MNNSKPIRVGVTGLNGFLGRHLKWLLGPTPADIEIIHIPISVIGDQVKLSSLVKGLDVLVHLGKIHPLDVKTGEEVYEGNVSMAKNLVSAFEKLSVTPYVIFSSTTQIFKDNPYGKSKKESGEILKKWAEKNGAKFSNLIIPHEFGESATMGRISVVTTFCDDLVNNRESKVSEEAEVFLIHAQDVVKEILNLIQLPKNGEIVFPGVQMKVSDLYKKLSYFKNSYYSDVIPKLENKLDISLFNNLRWHIFESGFYPKKLILKTDERGSLFEMIKEYTGGQTFASSTKPGITRGNHYHTRKIERFCVIKGQAEIALRIVGGKKVHTFKVDGDNPVYIDMPTFFTHNIKNVGNDELLTIFWCNEIFDPNDPDTFYLTV